MIQMTTRSWIMALVPLLLAALLPAHAAEQAAPRLTIEQAVMARQVEARQPVGEATTFPADVGQVACYTKVMGAAGETFIEHIWLRGEEENARVRLAVRSPAWRTWSTKRIRSDWTGEWTVRIEDADGRVLDTLTFTIGEGSLPEGEN